MMGDRQVMQEGLFYEFSIERHVPEGRHSDGGKELVADPRRPN